MPLTIAERIFIIDSDIRPVRETRMKQHQQSPEDDRMRMEMTKLFPETAKINRQNQWRPAIAASAATLAMVAVVKFLL